MTRRSADDGELERRTTCGFSDVQASALTPASQSRTFDMQTRRCRGTAAGDEGLPLPLAGSADAAAERGHRVDYGE
jgi:hypothetical protein